jgi:hypothetical protein
LGRDGSNPVASFLYLAQKTCGEIANACLDVIA